MAQTLKSTAARPARKTLSEPAEKPARPVKAEKPARPAKAEKPARPVKAEKPARPAKAEKPARPAKAGKPPKAASDGSKAAVAVASVKLKDIVTTVAAESGLKRPEAKQAVEATLAALAAALSREAVLVLPPLGKLRVARQANGVLTLKLRPPGGGGTSAGKALAADDEDS